MRITFIIAMLLLSLNAFAQNDSYCGTGIDEKSEKFLDGFFNGEYPIKSTSVIMWVPMTAHIVSPEGGKAPFEENDVLEALCTLNEDYANTNIQFYLSSFQYIYNDDYYDHGYQDGIQMMQQNNVFGTANSYFVENPADNCGYYAGAGQAVALAFGCSKKTDHTWAHEMGHYFSLPHTFRGWEGEDYADFDVAPNYINSRKVEKAGVDPDCDIAGDRFCDTPADYLSFRWTCNGEGISSELQTDPDSVTFRSDGSYIMSYSNDACVDKFSPMQIEAMVSNLQNTKSEQIDDSYISQPLISIDNTVAIYPINGESISENSVPLDWEENGGAKYYYLEVSRFPQYQFPLVQEWVTSTSYNLADLVDGKTYYWRLTPYDDSGFCTTKGESNTFVTNFVVSNEEDFIDNSINMYPNPSSNRIFIQAEKIFSGSMKIYNSQMLQVDEKVFSNVKSIEHNHELPAGLYLVEINNGKNKITKKLIVQ